MPSSVGTAEVSWPVDLDLVADLAGGRVQFEQPGTAEILVPLLGQDHLLALAASRVVVGETGLNGQFGDRAVGQVDHRGESAA
jgi:hypothetical protein